MKLAFIGLCNLIDTFATLHLFQTGMFVELNPFMAFILKNPIVFASVKTSVMTVILVRLWSVKEDKRTKIANGTGYIYVPRALVDQYASATNWSTLLAKNPNVFRAIEDFSVDGTVTGELDESKI